MNQVQIKMCRFLELVNRIFPNGAVKFYVVRARHKIVLSLRGKTHWMKMQIKSRKNFK